MIISSKELRSKQRFQRNLKLISMNINKTKKEKREKEQQDDEIVIEYKNTFVPRMNKNANFFAKKNQRFESQSRAGKGHEACKRNYYSISAQNFS